MILSGCFKTFWEASLVAQWKSNSLQRRGSQSHPRSWLGRIPRAMEQLVRAPQCWACAPEPRSHNHWATLSEPVLRNEGRHHNEKSAHGNERSPCPLQAEKACGSNKDPAPPKIKLNTIKKKKKTLRFLTDSPNIKIELKFFWPKDTLGCFKGSLEHPKERS